MTITSGTIIDVNPAFGEVAETNGFTQTPVGATRYNNRVWDTQKGGSGDYHYWETDSPDVNGLEYDGPGTWGVHTSGHAVFRLL